MRTFAVNESTYQWGYMYFMHHQCRRALGVLAASLFSVYASASPLTMTAANPATDLTATDRITATRADPLLSVDLNRTDIVSKLIEQWKNDIAPAQRDSFRAHLSGLRADRLLAVSLVGSFDGVLEVLYGQEKSNTALSVLTATKPGSTDVLKTLKALGDVAADLVYTPITPCRILDTRLSSGGPGPRISGSTTAFNAVATTFVPQGGVSTNCNIPAGAAAIAGTFSMLSASNLGYVTLWAVDTPQPLAATGLFNPSSQQSLNMSSAIVPLCNVVSCTAGKQFNLFVSGSSLDVSFDVSGYFKAPGGTIGDITEIQTAAGSGLTGATTSGVANLSLAPTYKLPQGCISGNIAKYFATPTPVWECATDNGGGGTVTSVGAGIGINGGPVTTSGTLSIAPSFRLPQTCSNGQFTRFNNTLDIWECVTPAVVTSVATGPGLTGGPITATGTVSLATTQLLPTTACTTDQIIKWNGTAWVCASPPLTLPAGCLAGQMLQVGAGGTVVCASSPPFVAVLANLGVSSLGYTALALPTTDLLPFISFSDPSTSDLRVLKCGNAGCSAGNIVTTVDSVGSVGGYNSVAVSADGFPIISYLDSTNQALKVAKCGNASCSSGNTVTTVDSAFNVGFYTSIVVPADGLPIISYYDTTNQDLKVAKCGNASCSSGNTSTTVDSVGSVGGDTSIAVSADGFPVISYNAFPTGLKVVKCSSANCMFGNTITLVDSVGTSPGEGTSIVVPADGRPVISHYSPNLKVTKCGNASCSSGNTSTVVDNTITQAGFQTSIAISTDGLPVISYADGVIGRAKVAKCSNASCSSGTTITTINSVDSVSQYYVPMKLSTDGKPVIVVNKTSNFDLVVLKCSDVACVNP